MAVYYHIFYKRLLFFFWILVSLTLLIIILPFWMSLPMMPGELMLLIVILECIRVTIVAIWKKKAGGWIFGGAILLMICTIVLINQIGPKYLGPSQAQLLDGIESVKFVTPFSASIMILYLAVPLAMSAHLILQFDRNRRKLQRKLDEVQELSQKAISQEREKQVLITSQNERLEKEVAQRTEELQQSLSDLKSTQVQLVHAEKMASLGELTAGIAHEIQNPLNFVNNFSEINKELIQELREANADNNQEEFEQLIRHLLENEEKVMHHGKRADAIVKGMLLHSRIGGGEKELTDINALIEDYAKLAYQGMRAHDKSFNGDFQLDLAPDLPQVEVVPQDIGRVLVNLINNAFQAVSAVENGTVTVSTQSLNDKVEIQVADNGPGIPDEIKNKIFQPFFTTKSAGQGTGLGLSLSYDIVTKGHGGELLVKSKEGEGAELIVRLPVSKE